MNRRSGVMKEEVERTGMRWRKEKLNEEKEAVERRKNKERR